VNTLLATSISGLGGINVVGARHAVPLRFAPPCKILLERKLHRKLQLSRIADALSQEAVEIEQGRPDGWFEVVFVVEGIEHLDDGDQRIPTVKPKLEGTLQPPVE
jgi:hypothetical protein